MELNSLQLQDEHLRQNKSNILPISGNTNYLYLKMSMWILIRLRAGNRVSIPGLSKRFFSSLDRPEQLWRPSQHHIQWVARIFCWGKKRPVCEINHSAQSSAKVKNKCIYTSTTSVRLNVVDRTILHLIVKSLSKQRMVLKCARYS